MNQKYNFVAATYNLKLDRVTNRGIRLFNDLRLSSAESIQGIIDEQLKDIMGILEYEQLLKGPYYYAIGKGSSERDLHLNENALLFLDYFLTEIQIINNLLWLVKDHSINTETAYIKVESGGEITLHSNHRPATFFNAKGKRDVTEFTTKELKYAISLKEKLFEEESFDSSHKSYTSSENVIKASRIDRTFYFLQTARAEGFLPLRISNFVTILETLLSTTKGDVTHKLRERMAWLLGESFENRLEIYKLIGNVYSVRSNCVHGSSMPKGFRTNEKLEELSISFEQLVRRLILKIIGEEDIFKIYKDNKEDEIESWLLELCLGSNEK
ncbi:hypothetical protein [Peribacillus muralis]|uniref:hypothetical protein n=1 Tax=Peribacillus muralis TaxID=264697 RepID=UPI003D02BBE7